MKDKRNILIIIGIIAFIIILGGISYSYFVYNKNLGDVSVNTGEISINYSDVNGNMSLTGIVPKSDNEGKISTDYIDFTVDGIVDTDKIYYELSIIPDSNNTIDSQYVKVYLTDQSDNVIKSVSLYNSLQLNEQETGKRIYRDTIDPNQDGSKKTYSKDFRLRVWLDENYSEQTTKTFEFNVNLYAKNVDNDFEIREGLRIISKNVMTPANSINFANISSSSNGQGLYILPGTENDANPIYYFRGAINNNNVIFGDYCWQIVRTTDTGGIKMIYNGIPDIEGSGDNTTYNCGITRSFQDDIKTTTSLSQSTGYYYADDYEIVSTEGNGATYRLKSKNNPIIQVPIATASDASTNIPTIVTNYPYTCKKTTDTGTCTILYKVDSYASGTDAYVYSSTDISIIGDSEFSSQRTILADVGYMKNTGYTYIQNPGVTGSIFGKNVEWDGTNYLVIEDEPSTASTNTTRDNNHHYSCGTAGTTSCSSVRYYYFDYNYITLTNGELVEDAIYKMTGNVVNQNIDVVARNQGYVLNQNDSTIKTAIESWFRTNLTNEVDSTKRNYAIYVEDTVYCNDRSFKTITGNASTYQESGWNPNGGDLTNTLHFGTWNRFYNSWYSITNVPSTICPNETDRFSVSSSVAHLNYPIGLLTVDEIIAAGVSGSSYASNTSYYLYTGDGYWSLSPSYFYGAYAGAFPVVSSGSLNSIHMDKSYGLRPVISLKPGIEFETGGDGTPTNPYVVKYE